MERLIGHAQQRCGVLEVSCPAPIQLVAQIRVHRQRIAAALVIEAVPEGHRQRHPLSHGELQQVSNGCGGHG